MYQFRKLTAFFSALVMAVTLTGCMSNGPSVAEEDLPYGATMRESKTTFALPVSYDRRFLNDAQITAITDYLSSIQNCDGEAYANNTIDFYADYQLNEVYQDTYETFDEMLADMHTSIANSTADDFQFNMITVTGFSQERVSSGMNTMIELLADISGNADFEQTLTNCWTVRMDWMIRYNGSSTAIVEDRLIYLFEIEGEYYCVM
ncbi:MAG: hypothetical protein E7502_04515 [Ruminococcus sp.]|nr:hypothetical protein [Ruminococcus sp.]